MVNEEKDSVSSFLTGVAQELNAFEINAVKTGMVMNARMARISGLIPIRTSPANQSQTLLALRWVTEGAISQSPPLRTMALRNPTNKMLE